MTPAHSTYSTLPLSAPARFVARTASWRNGLRHGNARRDERFGTCASYEGVHTASLLAYLAPRTTPGVSEPVACGGYGPCIVQLGGRWQGRVSFEASDDGIAWYPVKLIAFGSGATAAEAIRHGMWRTAPGFAAQFLRVHAQTITGAMIAVVAAAATHPVASSSVRYAA